MPPCTIHRYRLNMLLLLKMLLLLLLLQLQAGAIRASNLQLFGLVSYILTVAAAMRASIVAPASVAVELLALQLLHVF